MASHGSESSAVSPGRGKPGPEHPDLAKEMHRKLSRCRISEVNAKQITEYMS